MTMKWMISFQSSGICSVNNPRNAFQFPCISSFIQKKETLKRDIWDQTKCRVLWNWNFKMHFLFIPYLEKRMIWSISNGYILKMFSCNFFATKSVCFFSFVIFFLLVQIYTIPATSRRCRGSVFICYRRNNNPDVHEYSFPLVVEKLHFLTLMK